MQRFLVGVSVVTAFAFSPTEQVLAGFIVSEIVRPGTYEYLGSDIAVNRHGDVVYYAEKSNGVAGIYVDNGIQRREIVTGNSKPGVVFSPRPDLNNDGDVVWRETSGSRQEIWVKRNGDAQASLYFRTDGTWTVLDGAPRIADRGASGGPPIIGRGLFSNSAGNFQAIWNINADGNLLVPIRTNTAVAPRDHRILFSPVLSEKGSWFGFRSQVANGDVNLYTARTGTSEDTSAFVIGTRNNYATVNPTAITDQGVIAGSAQFSISQDEILFSGKAGSTVKVIANDFDGQYSSINVFSPGINSKLDSVFLAHNANNGQVQIVFQPQNGSPQTVVQTGDRLLQYGEIVGLNFTADGSSEDRIAFEASFASGQTGIFLARPSRQNGPYRFVAPFLGPRGMPITRTDHDRATDILQDRFAIDFGGAAVPVTPAEAGVAYVFEDSAPGYGHYVIVDHSPEIPFDDPNVFDKIFTIYAHLDQVRVSDGEHVVPGESVLGISGNSGSVMDPESPQHFNPHLHFGVQRGRPFRIVNDNRVVNINDWSSVLLTPEFGTINLGYPQGEFQNYTYGELQTFADEGTTVFSPYALRQELNDVHGHLSFGERVSHTIDFLLDGNPFLNYQLEWEGSSLSIDIYDPNGELYDSILESDGDIEGLIRRPIEGLWTFSINAVDVPAGGEPYSFSVTPAVPEPDGLILIGLALALLTACRGANLPV